MTRNARVRLQQRLATTFTLVLLVALAGFASATAADSVPLDDIDLDLETERDPYEFSQPLLSGLDARVERPIALNDAVAIGLQNNLDVQVERFSPMQADLEQGAAWGAYDPTFSGNYDYQNVDVPSANGISGLGRSTIEGHEGKTQFSALIPYIGATLNADFSASGQENSFPFQVLQPEYAAAAGVNASIPLLRGLIWNEAWTNIKTSAKATEISNEEFRTQVMNTVQQIRDGYWALVAAKEQVRVARKSLETAQALLDQSRTQYDVGVVSKVAVVEAEAGVADRQFSLIVQENNYYRSQDALIDLVLGRDLQGTSNLAFVPVDSPDDFERMDLEVGQAVATAFAKRPELKAAEREVERAEYNLKLRKRQRLPQFDVRGGYSASGLAGFNDGSTPPIPAQDTGLGDAIGRIGGPRGGSTYSAGAVFSIPLSNTEARKRATIADLELRKAKTRKQRVEQQVILDVRDRIRGLNSAFRGIHAAERRRLAAEEQLRAERIRLEHGESTPFDVLQRESDLVDAESQKITALQAYRDSVSAVNRAQGTILDINNVSIEAVRALR